MKTAYENSTTQPLGASYLPKNVIREEHASAGESPTFTSTNGFHEARALANRAGQDQALLHFGVKNSSLLAPGTPKTNEAAPVLPKENPAYVPNAGTGPATNGAQYGAETRK